MSNYNYEIVDYYHIESEAELEGESNRALMRWWLSFAPEIPKRSDFDIIDHLALAPDIFLVERKSETAFEFKLHGENAHNIFDDDAGKVIRSDAPITNQQEREEVRLANYYNEIIENPVCMKNVGRLYTADKQYKKYESIDCPLVNETGEVSHIIGTITALE